MVNLFLALILPALAAVDTVGPAIEQAQALALKKNRVEAAATLQRALASTPTTLKSRAKLTETLAQISKVFFTDKGQKAYESGQATMWETPDLALTQFRSSLELEDGNVLVQGAVARVLMLKQDCDGALSTIVSAQKINANDPELAALELRALTCLQRYEQVRERMKSMPALDKWQDLYVQYVLALEALQAKSWRRVNDTATKLTESEPGFPEGHYLLYKSGSALSKDIEASLQKYVSLCKGLTIRERKRYSLEPRLCTNLKEAEDELAKKSTDI